MQIGMFDENQALHLCKKLKSMTCKKTVNVEEEELHKNSVIIVKIKDPWLYRTQTRVSSNAESKSENASHEEDFRHMEI